MVLPQLHHEDTIGIDNPSYSLYTGQGSDDILQPNPSYEVYKPNSKTTEDQYEYVRTTEFKKHHNREDDVNIESNPSYGMLRGEGNSNTGRNVIIEPNPSYKVVTRIENNTKTTPGSDVVTAPNLTKPNPHITDQNDDDYYLNFQLK